MRGRPSLVRARAAVEADMVMNTVNVDLGDRTYPIYIGPDLTDKPELLTNHIRGKRALVVTNATIAPLYLDKCAFTSSSPLNDPRRISILPPNVKCYLPRF